MSDSNHAARREETVTVDPDGGYHYEADDDESLSEAVVSSVSAIRGVEPTALDPLYDSIDPDGLDSLFASNPALHRSTDARIEFAYAGYDVTVYADGRVVVDEID